MHTTNELRIKIQESLDRFELTKAKINTNLNSYRQLREELKTNITLIRDAAEFSSQYDPLVNTLVPVNSVRSPLPPSVLLCEKIKEQLMLIANDPHSTHVKVSVHLSERFSRSYTSLSKMFSANTGVTIEQFLINARINKAKSLIAEGNSISDIAYRLNYSSVAAFSNQFKKINGCSPSSYKTSVSLRSTPVFA